MLDIYEVFMMSYHTNRHMCKTSPKLVRVYVIYKDWLWRGYADIITWDTAGVEGDYRGIPPTKEVLIWLNSYSTTFCFNISRVTYNIQFSRAHGMQLHTLGPGYSEGVCRAGRLFWLVILISYCHLAHLASQNNRPARQTPSLYSSPYRAFVRI